MSLKLCFGFKTFGLKSFDLISLCFLYADINFFACAAGITTSPLCNSYNQFSSISPPCPKPIALLIAFIANPVKIAAVAILFILYKIFLF